MWDNGFREEVLWAIFSDEWEILIILSPHCGRQRGQSWHLEDRWNLGYSQFILLESEQINLFLKGQFTHKSKIRKSPLTCSAACVSTYFWHAWPSFGAIGVEYNGSRWHLACGAQGNKNIKLNSNVSSRDPDPVTQDNPQTLLFQFHVGAVFFLPHYAHQSHHHARSASPPSELKLQLSRGGRH